MNNPTQYTTMQQTMKERWRPEWSSDPALAELGAVFHRLFNVSELVVAQGAKLRASGKYSVQGLTDAVRALGSSQNRGHSFALGDRPLAQSCELKCGLTSKPCRAGRP